MKEIVRYFVFVDHVSDFFVQESCLITGGASRHENGLYCEFDGKYTYVISYSMYIIMCLLAT